MKYLLIRRSRYSFDYQVEEFHTPEELGNAALHSGTHGAILAQRIELKTQVCDWLSPVKIADDSAPE